MWDYKTKRSLFIHRDLPDSVSSIAFNSDGTMLGIATSNLYENGKPQSNEWGLYVGWVDHYVEKGNQLYLFNNFDCVVG